MNVIFLTLSNITSIEKHSLYPDLLRKFRDEGHQVYVVKPNERRIGLGTTVTQEKGCTILGVKVLNIQKANIIEKGIGTILLEKQYISAINKHFKGIEFDLILYSTPPITLAGAVKRLKKSNPKAISYLLLKDIFPQNAVDIGMMKQGSLLHKMFVKKEHELYRLSDYIGCMSPANVEFILKHNPWIDPSIVEVAPNSVELTNLPPVNRNEIRQKYNVPTDKSVFIYGGNLGKPQGIPFLIKCLEANLHRQDCFFLIVGGGTEYSKLETWFKNKQPANMMLRSSLPKEDYDILVQSCDIGMIFLDYRFLIPNFPSRLLSYLQYRMPVLVATDPNCDEGSIAEANGFGMYCPSNDVTAFTACVNRYVASDTDIKAMGKKGYDFLCKNYLVEHTYHPIMNHFQ